MTEEQRKSIERMKDLCEQALNGQINYEQFHDELALEIERAPEP